MRARLYYLGKFESDPGGKVCGHDLVALEELNVRNYPQVAAIQICTRRYCGYAANISIHVMQIIFCRLLWPCRISIELFATLKCLAKSWITSLFAAPSIAR